MKKLFTLIFLLAFTVVLAGCGEKKTYEIAMITDVGTIDDRSFNQGSWEGVVEYAEEHDISHKYYKPREKSTEAYLDAIALAVKAGAEVVVTPGFLFEGAIYEAQDEYEDVTFILLDGTPNNVVWADDGSIASGEWRTEDNVYSIVYAEDQSGFMAGYAAVKEGFTKLGFMGGMAVPAVIRFGHGFVQGAEVAATEMGLAADAIEMKYTYLGDFGPSADHQTKAASWYNAGTEVIFVAAGGAGSSVMAAAEAQNNKYVIGVDVDQASQSTTVITSAKKELAISVYDALEAYYDEDDSVYKTGETITLDVTNDGVGLPTDFSRFPNKDFTLEDYNTLLAALKADTSNIRTNIVDATNISATELTLTKVDLTVQE